MVLVVRLASYNVFSGSLENFRPFFPSFQCPYDKVNSYEKLSKSESLVTVDTVKINRSISNT